MIYSIIVYTASLLTFEILSSSESWTFRSFVPNGTKFDESRLSRNLNGRFSLNFTDSNMAMRRIICASLGEFLCSKLEISLKTQENIFRSEQNLTKVDYLKI